MSQNRYAAHWKGPAKAKKPPPGMEGVTYTRQWTGFQWRRRKPTLEDLQRTQAALDIAKRDSDAIRARARVWIVPVDGQKHGRGLWPLPPNYYQQALARAIAEAEAAPVKRPRKVSPKVDAAPTPASVATVAAAVRARANAERALVREVARARDAGASMTALAGELAMSRQGLYKYLARA